MKPLAYVFPDDPKTYARWDEYMLGSTFLIAPILDSTDSRTVYLPKGTWLDYNNLAASYQGNSEIVISTPLDQSPVYVRTNSMYVSGMLLPGNSKLWMKNQNDFELKIYIFPGSVGESVVFDYVDYKDGNKEKKLSLHRDKKKTTFSSPSLADRPVLLVKADKEPSTVIVNRRVHSYSWDQKEGLITIKLERMTDVNVFITP
jgi:alpha-glucosidase (family GH31 glycosyl hydrolase)